VLIVKTQEKMDEAKKIFGNLKVTMDECRHLGAAIRTTGFKEWYVGTE